jgi:hypothetical protein
MPAEPAKEDRDGRSVPIHGEVFAELRHLKVLTQEDVGFVCEPREGVKIVLVRRFPPTSVRTLVRRRQSCMRSWPGWTSRRARCNSRHYSAHLYR